jgi:hypothetical protein
MNSTQNSIRLAQSASALGAAILGFGIGAKLGDIITGYAFLIIAIGSIIHVSGMYIMQVREGNQRSDAASKALWISAWICLIALVILIVYLIINR